jgi:outer membrane receptor protein involved in Fe transport
MKRLIGIFFMLFAIFSYGQTTITGKVVDQNGNAVPNANVIVVGKSEGAVADFDGNFTLETSETPPFQIKVSSIGYSEALADVASNNQTLTVVLNETSTALDEIVISASRTPERIFESPVSVERFGIKDIENATAESFYGSLQNLKGVDINTNSLTFQSVNTRGFATFANVRFMQLVDGMDNTAPGLNFVLGNLVGMNELDVQSVEILPGAASALYGAGAFNGILFMQSKNPFDFQGISSYFKTGITSQEAAGNNPYYDVGIRAAHAFNDKFAIKANFSLLQGEDWYATRTDDVNNPGADRTDPAYDGLNVYGDEVSTPLNFDALAGLPSGTLGTAVVSRTGYNETDLMDYNAQSVKADLALHYRPFGDDLEVIYNGRIGRGTTIYQGINRYYVDGFKMQQHKLEVKNDNFFIRGYIVAENSGNAYDSRFAAINTNRRWKGDTQWFTEYASTFIGARLGVGTGVQATEEQAHAAARAVADTGRLIPGTPEFQRAFNSVISDGDLATGARFIDNTKFRHVNGNYNLAHLIDDWADIQIGGSFREYELNSQGTIFTDIDGPITYSEYGAYLQFQKKFVDDRLKLTLSGRYDKNEFFDGFFSPRAALGITLGERRNHNLRFSVQTGFRNPTTQDLFIGLDAGRAVLVGSAPTNLDRDVRTFELSQAGQDLTGNNTATVIGRQAYENAWDAVSLAGGNFQAVETPLVQPEEITAFEAGYRAQIGKFSIDMNAYYNQYTNFIGGGFVQVPFYGNVFGNPQEQGLAQLAVANGDSKTYQTYTNSPEELTAYGANIGVDTKLGGFDLGVSYTYNLLEDEEEIRARGIRTNFNTPEHRFKASFGHTELFKNFGFGVNYRWSDEYFWEASFQDGEIDSFSVLDAQVNYAVPSIKSIFKLGGSNILADEYVTAFGSANIGAIYYLSWSINP